MAPKNAYPVIGGPNKLDLMLGLFEPNFFDYIRKVKFILRMQGGDTDHHLVVRSVERVCEERWNIVADDPVMLDVFTIAGYDARTRTGTATVQYAQPSLDPMEATPDRLMHWRS